MPSPIVDAAFKSRLEANWTATPAIGVGDVNVPPSDGSSFLVVQYPVVNGNKPTLGRRYFEDGAARLVLNVERSIYEVDGYSWASVLASLFRDRKFGGIQTFTPSGPIVNDAIQDGNLVELSVIVPYRYQFDD